MTFNIIRHHKFRADRTFDAVHNSRVLVATKGAAQIANQRKRRMGAKSVDWNGFGLVVGTPFHDTHDQGLSPRWTQHPRRGSVSHIGRTFLCHTRADHYAHFPWVAESISGVDYEVVMATVSGDAVVNLLASG